jgi:hypothetical protein
MMLATAANVEIEDAAKPIDEPEKTVKTTANRVPSCCA